MRKYFLLIVTLLCMQSTLLISEDEDVKKILPLLLNGQTAGTEYYITFHPCWETNGKNNFIGVYISSKVATKVTLTIPALNLTLTGVTIPNDVIEFKLSPTQAQMYSKPAETPPLPTQVWTQRAIHITADDPIVVYGVTRYQYTSDGFLALPVSSLGKEYLIASWADPSPENSQWLTSYTSVVGIYDNTKVSFRAGGGESTGNVLMPGNDTIKPNGIIKTTLSPGDVWLIASIGGYSDLSGSKVTANNPIAVISGNFCAYIPTWVSACDYIIEQELPTNMYSEKFHVSPIANRLKNSWIKIFASKPGTKVYKDGNEAGFILTPGGTTGKGYLELVAADGAKRPVTYSSDPGFPINVVQFNNGQSDDGVQSDPFQMALIPTDLYQNEVIFNTPGIRGGFGFALNYINLVYKATENGKIPDDIEFGTVVAGNITWKQLNTIDTISGAAFNDTDPLDGRRYKSKTIKLAQDGVYHLRSKDKIAVYAYGFGDHDSYGFPANFNAKSLEFDEQKKPTCDIISSNSNEIKGIIYEEPRQDIENRANLSNVIFLKSQSENFEFTSDKIFTGSTSIVNWSLKQLDLTLPAIAFIVAKDYAGNDTVFKFSLKGSNIALPKPVLIAPANNSIKLLTNFTFKWKKAINAKIYTLELSDNIDFNLPLQINKGITDTFLIANEINTDSKYFWRIRAFNETDSSIYSETWQFATIQTLPSVTELILPLNNASNILTDVNFKWYNAFNTKKYTLDIDDSLDFDPPLQSVSNLLDTISTIKGLNPDSKYYWRVISYNAAGKSQYSVIWQFTTIQTLPSAPELILPNNKSKNLAFEILFTWKSALNTKTYTFEIDDNSDFSSIFKTVDTKDTFVTIKDFSMNTNYFWRVKAINNMDKFKYSTDYTFTTGNFLPIPPNLIYPEDNAKDVRRDVVISWSANSLNTEYQIQIAYDPNFKDISFDKKLTASSFSTNLDKKMTYFWRVKALNQYGESEWSATRWFITNDMTSVHIKENQNLVISPNPAKDFTIISYNLVEDSHIKIEVFDVNGSEVATLINQIQSSGDYKLDYNCSSLSSQQYLMKITINNKTSIEKLIIQK